MKVFLLSMLVASASAQDTGVKSGPSGDVNPTPPANQTPPPRVGGPAGSESLATAACDDLSSGDTCTYSDPGGNTVTSTCYEPDSPDACGPDVTSCVMCASGGSTVTMPADGGGITAVTVCAGADLNAACTFSSVEGLKVTGFCVDQGAGACGPAVSGGTGDDSEGEDTASTSDDSDGGKIVTMKTTTAGADSSTCYVCSGTEATNPPVSGPACNNECCDLEAGDACEVVRTAGNIYGVCVVNEQGIDTGDGAMSCSPAASHPSEMSASTTTELLVNPLIAACVGIDEDATCTYKNADGTSTSGTCENTSSSRTALIQCINTQIAVTEAVTDTLELACVGMSKDDTCSAEYPLVTISGTCIENEDESSLYCSPSWSLRH